MFEPVHGAAFDITGKGVANPLATILACSLMLEHLGESEAAKSLDRAVQTCLEQGQVKTPDLGGSDTTSAVGDEIVRLVRKR
jgi:tartrate dehydrogenase/decarboxylase/D-malate dehydrogenase